MKKIKMKTSDLKLIKKNGGKAYVSEDGKWHLRNKSFHKSAYQIKHIGHALRIHVNSLSEAKKVIVDIINNNYVYEELPSAFFIRAKKLNPSSVDKSNLVTKVWDLKKGA
jgi:hypothetical protein